MVDVDGVARERVTVSCGVDAPPAELDRLIIRQVPVVSLVKDTVRKSATGTN